MKNENVEKNKKYLRQRILRKWTHQLTGLTVTSIKQGSNVFFSFKEGKLYEFHSMISLGHKSGRGKLIPP